MKSKSKFHYPWPMIIEDSDRSPDDEKMITNLRTTMQRLAILEKRNDNIEFSRRLNIISEKAISTSEEHHFAQAELSKRKIIGGLMKRTLNDGTDTRCAVAMFLGISEIIVAPYVNGLDDLDEVRQLGEFYRNSNTINNFTEAIHNLFSFFRTRSNDYQLRLYDMLSRMAIIPRDDFDGVLEYVISFMETMEINDLLGLFEPSYDKDVFEDAINCKFESDRLFGDDFDWLSQYTDRLRVEMDNCWKVFNSQSEKIMRTSNYIIDPITISNERWDQQNYFLPMLLQFQKAIVVKRVNSNFPLPEKISPFRSWKLVDEIIDDLGNAELLIFGSTAQYWFMVFLQILSESKAIQDNRLVSGTIPLLISLIKHPKNIRKAKCHKSLDKTKAVLSKFIAPHLIGYHNDLEKALHDEKALKLLPGRDVIHIFSSYIAKAHVQYFRERSDLYKRKQRKAAKFLFKEIVVPHLEKFLFLFCQALHQDEIEAVTSLDDLELHFLESSLSEDDERDTEILKIEKTSGVVSEEWQAEHDWSYVPNLQQGIGSAERLPADFDGKLEALTSIFRKFKNKQAVGVKTESILRALKYFERMTSTLRRFMPVEVVGGKPWVKIKRGRVRILVRIETESQLFFHVFPRKEWKFGMFLNSH